MSYWNGHRWEAQSPPTAEVKSATPSRAKRVGVAVVEATLVTALTFGLIAGATFAGRGGGSHKGGGTSGGGTVELAPLVVDNNGDGLPDWGDVVTFNIATSASSPFVNLQCSQGGVLVLSGWKGYFAGSLDTNWNFGLSSGAWQGGAASCTAYLKVQNSRGSWTTLASTNFSAGG